MRTLQTIISRYMYRVSGILVVLILGIVLMIERTNERDLVCESTMRTFSQMEQILEENQEDLEETQKEYRQTCLHNAEIIARIIEGEPGVLEDVEELKKIAKSLEVDEIHIFDDTGRIFAGTHPKYYGYTVDSGEQMEFFKPMLEDKDLKLVQDITPNTAEGKQMQYSALWNNSGEFIVQVGMEPVNVIKVTKKNELSYIFSLFRVDTGINYYAVDSKTGAVVGCTDQKMMERNISDIGLDFANIKGGEEGFDAEIDGGNSFCVFKKIGDNYIGGVILKSDLYRRLPTSMFLLFCCLAVIAIILSRAVIRYINNYVVDEIHSVNKTLKAIENGNLEETVDSRSSIEFFELGKYINRMVKSLVDNNKKISYVLSKTDMHIGVYEYDQNVGKFHFTDYISKILPLDKVNPEKLFSDVEEFKKLLNEIRANPTPDETGIYEVGERYIKVEQIEENDRILGVLTDRTAEIIRRREIAKERDIDPLTGLYNRRGLDRKLSALFKNPEQLGLSVMIMIDADDLKEVNDTYGHEIGDIYLEKMSGLIRSFGTKSSIVARQGGDEFVLFLYQYEDEELLLREIEAFTQLQDHNFMQLGEKVKVPLRFSFGCCLRRGSIDYPELLREADQKMYENKQERKAKSFFG
ncbi:MAG: diguanylate cyclase domain-containing protein [Lachnospiraceae bacterium]|jgi:diguanylate cyclase (GGDEF)-like protein